MSRVHGCVTGAVLALAACSFDHHGLGAGGIDASADGSTTIDASTTADAPVDAPPGTPDASPDATIVPGDAMCASLGFTPANVDPCALPPSGGALTITTGTWTLDTGGATITLTDNNNQPVTISAATIAQTGGGPMVAAVTADTINVDNGATLRVTGTRPLVLVGLTSVTIAGVVDVSAAGHVQGPGAGSDAQCKAVVAGDGFGAAGAILVDDNNHNGGGGGGGGGFGLTGAEGGLIDKALNNPSPAAGGLANGGASISPLRGGCHGGNGGNGGGAAGGGGGAIQISTPSLTVSGAIAAAGGGGAGAAATKISAGGAGGGSGGAILLDAAAITLGPTGKLTANGGGGGQGHRATFTGGDPGQDGHKTDAMQALGGQANNLGSGDGGDGGSLQGGATAGQLGPQASLTAGAGGGGGGEVGRIHLRVPTTTIGTQVVSPAAQ